MGGGGRRSGGGCPLAPASLSWTERPPPPGLSGIISTGWLWFILGFIVEMVVLRGPSGTEVPYHCDIRPGPTSCLCMVCELGISFTCFFKWLGKNFKNNMIHENDMKFKFHFRYIRYHTSGPPNSWTCHPWAFSHGSDPAE